MNYKKFYQLALITITLLLVNLLIKDNNILSIVIDSVLLLINVSLLIASIFNKP